MIDRPLNQIKPKQMEVSKNAFNPVGIPLKRGASGARQ